MDSCYSNRKLQFMALGYCALKCHCDDAEKEGRESTRAGGGERISDPMLRTSRNARFLCSDSSKWK